MKHKHLSALGYALFVGLITTAVTAIFYSFDKVQVAYITAATIWAFFGYLAGWSSGNDARR